MVVIPTRRWIRVNPERARTGLPVPVGLAVDGLGLCDREDVEHIVAFLRVVGRARVAALVSGPRGGKRRIGVEGVARDAAQEVDLVLLRALLVFYALGEVLELLGVARVAHRLADSALVRRLLVGVDRLADLAQGAAQLLLLGALYGELAHGQRDRCKKRDDRHGDDELDKGKAPGGESQGAAVCHGTRGLPALLRLHAAERHHRASGRRGPGLRLQRNRYRRRGGLDRSEGGRRGGRPERPAAR